MNCANSAAYGAYLGDARIILLPVYWLGIYMNICVDANLQTRQLVSGSSAAIVYHLVVISAVALQLTPNSHTSTMLRYNKRAMTTNDFLLNSLGTMTILTTRTAYRKRTHLKKKVECSPRFQCVSYRCRVKLQVKDDTPLHHVGQGPLFDAMSDEVRVVTASLTKQHFRFVNHGTTFLPEDFVYSSIAQRVLHQQGSADGQSSGWWARCVLLGSGFSSIVFTALGYVCENYSLSVLGSSGIGNCAMSTIGFASMLSFSVVFTSCLNRGLLRELMFSFDFAFVSVQLTLAHLCVCDLFFWDIRCVTMLFMWLSMHWVLLLDALIPSVKQQLGLRTKAAIPVAMLFLVWMLHIIGDLLFESSSVEYQDRTVWSISVFGHSTDFRVVAFFFSRVWTLTLWSLRVLWRTWQRGDDDMITIQGNVEFIAILPVSSSSARRCASGR